MFQHELRNNVAVDTQKKYTIHNGMYALADIVYISMLISSILMGEISVELLTMVFPIILLSYLAISKEKVVDCVQAADGDILISKSN